MRKSHCKSVGEGSSPQQTCANDQNAFGSCRSYVGRTPFPDLFLTVATNPLVTHNQLTVHGVDACEEGYLLFSLNISDEIDSGATFSNLNNLSSF